MGKLFNKMFICGNAWTIGYRRIDNQNNQIPKDGNAKIKYQMITISDRYYYADPFLFENEGKTYLFCEMMDRTRGIGSIAVSEFDGKKFGQFKEIIKEPFHMSYPNVFSYNGNIYMIPESSAINEIRIYKAEKFPYVWKYEKTILSGKAYVDTSLYVHENRLTIFSYFLTGNNKGIREKYEIDNLDGGIKKDEGIQIINERPAGNPISIGEKMFSPLQDCTDYYGKGIIWGELDKLIGVETNSGYLSAKSYDMNPKIKNVTGTHTINRSEHFEVIDIRFDKFCLTKQVLKLINRIKRGNNED